MVANEIVLYKSGEQFQLEVQLKDDTVWLTQEQIAILFGTKRPAITKHLSNIYQSGELDEHSTCSILEHMGNDGKQRYQTKYYNLDAILSVGYRVNSKNATLFRKWATAVLKDYVLKGYAVNQQLLSLQRQIDSRFDIQEHRFQTIEKELHEHKEKIDFFVRTNVPPVEQVFFDGQFFEARLLLEQLIKLAKTRVVVVDAYIDAATFEMLDVRQSGVTADIYSSSTHATLRDVHNATTGAQPVKTHVWRNPSHDRWLIIDDQLYHCGHSFKDVGHKISAIMLMGEDPKTILQKMK